MIIAFSEILFVLTFRLPPTEYELIFVSLLLTAGCCLLLQRGGGVVAIRPSFKRFLPGWFESKSTMSQNAPRNCLAGYRFCLHGAVVAARPALALYVWAVWTQLSSPPAGMGVSLESVTFGFGPARPAGSALFHPLSVIHENSCCAFIIFIGLLLEALLFHFWAFATNSLQGRPSSFAVHLLRFLFLFVVFWSALCVPLPRFWRDPNEDFSVLKRLRNGVWCTTYTHPVDADLIIKQFHTAGYGHKDYRHMGFPMPFRTCDDFCPTFLLLVHQVCIYAQMASQRRIVAHFATSKHISEIVEIDVPNRRIMQRKAKKRMLDECSPDLQSQLETLGHDLEAKRFHMDDAHASNWMWVQDAQSAAWHVVAIDGELYSQLEYWIAFNIIRNVDQRNVGILPLPGCHRCWHWMDGNRLSMKQVVEGRYWWPTASDRQASSGTGACHDAFEARGGRAALSSKELQLFQLYDQKALECSSNQCKVFGKCDLIVRIAN